MKKLFFLTLSVFVLGCAVGYKPLSVDQAATLSKIGTVSLVPENYRYHFIGGAIFKDQISVSPSESFNDLFNNRLLASLSAKNKNVSKVNIDQALLTEANKPGVVSLNRYRMSTEKAEKMILEHAKLQGYSHVITVFGYDNDSVQFAGVNALTRSNALKGGLGLRCQEGVFRGSKTKDVFYASVALFLWDVSSGKILFTQTMTPEGNAWTGKINSPLWVEGQAECNGLQNQESAAAELKANEGVFQGFIKYAVDEFITASNI